MKRRYFLKKASEKEFKKVSAEEYSKAEKEARIPSLSNSNKPVTTYFSYRGVIGRVEE